ncbi:hypothetical protein [Nocardia sp. NPDC052566]|uniref:hypothetical protein n=1 Tax=Nocardia sp. NPDC052566 TaxID=3364330 RepID=UPI0037CABE4E
MSDVVVVPWIFRQFGGVHAAQAATTAMAGAVDQAATVAAAVPVFGPIGADFVATFATAQANHMRSVAQLTVVHEASAAAAHLAATAYEGNEAGSAATFEAQRI